MRKKGRPPGQVHSGHRVLLKGPTGISWGLTDSWKALVEVRPSPKGVDMGMVGQADPEPGKQSLAHLLDEEPPEYFIVSGGPAEEGGGHCLGIP